MARRQKSASSMIPKSVAAAGPRGAPGRQVALLIDTRVASGRDILRGIGRYVREHRNWALIHELQPTEQTLPHWLHEWRGDGIIARVADRTVARRFLETGVPTVDVLGEVENSGLPLVHVDDPAIARLAAEHLLERGFRHFGFFGLAGRNWSERRGAAFAEVLAHSGHGLAVYEQSSDYRLRVSWEFRESRLAEWIKRLPKPVGVLVCSDQVGLDLLEACRQANVAVPDELAVVGVDNDEAFCEIGSPALSSIRPSHGQVGYQAATMLDALMRGESPPPRPVFVPPGGIQIRQSSDVLAIPDPALAKAIHLIRARACAGIGVDEIAARAGISRSVLQRRFRQTLRKTVHDEILSVKLKRACELLAETDFPLVDVAEQCGFNHQEYMGVIFRQRLKQTPAQYRRRNARRQARGDAEYHI
jgi:LacI family transcriptional regulator